jgi:hypothetical protein
MKSAALQQAVFTRLNHSSVTALLSAAYAPLTPIFTDVPQAADTNAESFFPFVTIGADVSAPNDTKDMIGAAVIVQIDVWARATSMLGLKAIGDAIDGRMRRAALTITGANHIDTELESATPLRDPDGKTKHLMLRYRVEYFETA